MKYIFLATSAFLITVSLYCGVAMDADPRLTTTLIDICAGCAVVGLALLGLFLMEDDEVQS